MSIKPRDDFFITLPSNVTGHPDNTPSNYTTTLPAPLELSGNWEVALLETHYFKDWPNFSERAITLITKLNNPVDKPEPYEEKLIADLEDELREIPDYRDLGYIEVKNGKTYNWTGDVDITSAPFAGPFHRLMYEFIRFTNVKYGKSVGFLTIPGGTYAHIKDVGKLLVESFPKWDFTSTFSEKTGKLSFAHKERTTYFAMEDPYVLLRLGYQPIRKKFKENIFYLARIDREGDRKATLDEIQSIFVYSDIVDYQIVGNTKATLMGVLPTKGSFNESQSWQFNPLQYLPLQSNDIRTITMKLCTPEGDPVQFLSGDSLCRLHFRRKIL